MARDPRPQGFDPGLAYQRRVAACRASGAYRTARARVVAALAPCRAWSPDQMRTAGGWSAVTLQAIDEATKGLPDVDMGLFGRSNLVADVLRDELAALRNDAIAASDTPPARCPICGGLNPGDMSHVRCA